LFKIRLSPAEAYLLASIGCDFHVGEAPPSSRQDNWLATLGKQQLIDSIGQKAQNL
jgi:hypothetical protein